MHIKQALQRRTQQQRLPPARKIAQRDHSQVIGSVHTGTLNFKDNQPFFRDHQPRDQVVEAKNYIKELVDPDYLELKDKQWNSSVAAPRKFSDFDKEESHKTKLLKIRLGFSDFSPLKQQQRPNYQGTDSRNSFQGWNVSTYMEKKQKNIGEQLTNLSALDNTIKYNKSKLSNYKGLKQRYDQTRNLNKSELMNNSDIISDLKSSFMFYNPNASPQKTNATVFKMYDQVKRTRLKLQQLDTQDSFNGSRAFKAKLSPTQKSKIKYIHYHTGCWMQLPSSTIPIESDASEKQSDYAWSCCQSQEKEGKGCAYRVEDQNKMNLASFSHA